MGIHKPLGCGLNLHDRGCDCHFEQFSFRKQLLPLTEVRNVYFVGDLKLIQVLRYWLCF